jgi:hypothetical protein
MVKNLSVLPEDPIVKMIILIVLGTIFYRIFFSKKKEHFDKCKMRKPKKNIYIEKCKISDPTRNYFEKLMIPIISKKIPGFNNFPQKMKHKILNPAFISFKNNIKKNNKLEKLNMLLKDKSNKEKTKFFQQIFNAADRIIS